MSDRDRMTEQVAALLEASGLSPAEARARAAESVAALDTAAPGSGWGHIHPADLPRVWQQAARAGRRRLVLEVTAEAAALDDDTGRVNVRVLDAEDWPEWTPEHTRQRAATDALLRLAPEFQDGLDRIAANLTDQAADARAGWSESDYMAHGEESPDVWDGEDLDVDPASVAQMPGAQELLPGVFLVPSRLETEQEAEARARAERELN